MTILNQYLIKKMYIGLMFGVALFNTISPFHKNIAFAKMPFLTGVNLAGAEFGQTMPGEHGTDYIYPEAKDITRYSKMGFNIIRLPFRWERLQPALYGKFNETEWAYIEAAMKAAQKNKIFLILDVHNYARRKIAKDGFKKDHMIGSAPLPLEAFLHFWKELARRSKKYKKVIFGLMNEPYDMKAKTWRPIAQKTILAIRAQKAKNLILVPGVAWSGAHSWMGDDTNNHIMSGITDPLGNIAIEVHQYLDHDSSGTHPKTVSHSIGVERLQAFQNWARRHKIKAFLGEFGAANDPVGLAAMHNMLKEVSANKDVWLGWSGWAAGRWWPDDDKFTLERTSKGVERKQTLLLQRIAKIK